MGSTLRVMTKNHLSRLLEPLWRKSIYPKLVTNFFFTSSLFDNSVYCSLMSLMIFFLQHLRVRWLMKNTWLSTMLKLLKLREQARFKWCVFLFLINVSHVLFLLYKFSYLLAILPWFFFQMELAKGVEELDLEDARSGNEDAGSDSDAWVVV